MNRPLILYILTVCCTSGKAKKGCVDPVSSDPHLMLDTRTYTDIVVFTCDRGYRLSSTYYFAQCTGGVWDQDIPTCEAVNCPVYRVLLLYPPEMTFSYGDTVAFSCPIEYDIKGPSTLTCGADSLWDNDLPECVVKECKLNPNGRGYIGHMNVTSSGRVCQSWEAQTPHIHAYYQLADQANYCRNPNLNSIGPWCYTTDPGVQWDQCDVPRCICDLPTRYDSHLIVANKDYYYDEYAYFSCDIGYELHGMQSIRCQADGSWLGTFPTCQAVECPIQANIDRNLLYQTRTYYVNDTVDLSCVMGFTLTGSSRLICGINKGWSTSFPTCTAVQCGISGHHPQLRYNYKMYQYPDEVHFSCPAGFDMVGQGILMCTADGSWSMPYPSCDPITCPSPGAERHLVYTEKLYGYGDMISLICQYGYTLEGSSTLVCGVDGRWNTDLPTCKAVPCPVPVTADEHLLLTNRSYRYTDELHLSCDRGYRVEGQASLVCQANRTWSGELPVCRPEVECPVFTMSDAMALSNSSGDANHVYGSKVEFTCSTGHVIVGPTSITCQGDGTWSSYPPRCVEPESQRDDMMSSGLVAGLITAFALLIVGVIIALLIAHKRKKKGKKKRKVRYPVRMESSFKRNYGEMHSEISDDYDSFSDSFDNMEASEIGVHPKAVSNTYYEFSPLSTVPEGTIAVDALGEFVNKDLRVEGYVISTFAKFKEGLQEPATIAKLPVNKSKNKYRHVFPYDTTRVCLEKDAGDTSDYINASYINGYEKIQKYVAAQGPIRTTINEFWKMVWQLGSTKVVMLTNLTEGGKMKCQQYWPNSGCEHFASITVTLEREEDLSTYIIRHLKVQKGNKTRSVTQFHYTAWPDQKAPPSASSLVQFYRKVETLGQVPDAPIVVHCSAGIGRTGTYIALACLVQEASATGYVSVTRCVDTLRRQRLNMVQTAKQFEFIHEALLEHLHGSTAIPVDVFRETFRQLHVEFEMLQSLCPKLPESAFLTGKKEENKSKNRYSNLLPVEKYRPILSTPVEGTNDFINAVFLSDGSKSVQYLTTQMPLPHTVIDLWRLVYEQHVTSIVMLNTELDQQNDTVGVYWPTEEALVAVGPFVVTEKTTKATHHLTDIHTFSLQYKQEMPTVVSQFRSRVWPASEVCPTSTLEFLRLLGLVREWQASQHGTVLVHCMNGLDKSGLFCVLDSTLQSADVTRLVDIQTTIKQMRRAQPQIIPNEKQYLFCYEAISMYLEQNSTYMNV